VASRRFERHGSEAVQQIEWAEIEPNGLIDSSQVESKLFLPLALSPRLTSRGHLPDGVGSRGLCTLGTIARNQLESPSLTGAHCRVDCEEVRAPAADRSVHNKMGPREIQQARAAPCRSGTCTAATMTSSANSAVHALSACFELSPPVTRLACTLFQRTGRMFQCRGGLATVKWPCILENSISKLSNALNDRQK
jgi:hypothetical protein